MEKKTIPLTPTTSAPLDLNLPPAENSELVKGSCNLENLVTHRRVHDDVSADCDLQCKRVTQQPPSFSYFTANSPGETYSNQFRQFGLPTSDTFLPINSGIAVVDDGTVYGRCQFDSKKALKVDGTHPRFCNANEFEYCKQGEPVNCNMAHTPFWLSSLPSYPGMVTGSGPVDGRFQSDDSYNPSFGSKHPDLNDDAHTKLRYNNQGECVNVSMMPSSLQLANSPSSQASGSLNLCSGLASGFWSNEKKQNSVTLNQPHHHHHRRLAYGGSVNFGSEDNASSLSQSGNQDIQIFDFHQTLHPTIPGTDSEPHAAFLSNDKFWNNVDCTGGGGSSQPNLLMHVRRMNHLATSKVTQNNRYKAAVHGSVRHSKVLGASVPAANVPHQSFLSPVQKGYQQNINTTTSVANPFISQMLGHHGYGQNMTPHGMNFVHTNIHPVADQLAVNYHKVLGIEGDTIQDSKHFHADGKILLQATSEGFSLNDSLGVVGSSVALQYARCTHTQASNACNVAAVNPSLQASGDSSHMARVFGSSQTLSSSTALIRSANKAVVPAPEQDKASAQVLSKSDEVQCATAHASSVQRKAGVPVHKTARPVAPGSQQPDVIRCTNAEAGGNSGGPMLLGARCDLCNIDLAFNPRGGGSASRPHDPPMSAVLPCGHRFHDSCLREVGVTAEACKDPHCIACSLADIPNAGGS